MADVLVFPFCTWKAPPAYFICTCATRKGFSLCLVWELLRCQLCRCVVRQRIQLKWFCSIPEVRDPELVQSQPGTETHSAFWPQSTKLSSIWPPANVTAHRTQPCGAVLLDIKAPDDQAELSGGQGAAMGLWVLSEHGQKSSKPHRYEYKYYCDVCCRTADK